MARVTHGSETNDPYPYAAKPVPVGRVTHTRANFIQFIDNLLEIIRIPLGFHLITTTNEAQSNIPYT
jgi:hypothetical protein